MKRLLFCFLCLIGSVNAVLDKESFETDATSLNYLNEITINFPCKVIIKQGSKNEYYVKGDPIGVRELKVRVQGGEILFQKKTLQTLPEDTSSIIIYITVKNLLRLNMEGDVSVDLKKIKGDKFVINAKGKSDIRADFDIKELNMNLSGSSTLELKGKVKRQEIDIKGETAYNASNLVSNEVEIDAQGAGQVTVTATKKLTVVITGPLTVSYTGTPKKIEKNTSGGGVLRKI